MHTHLRQLRTWPPGQVLLSCWAKQLAAVWLIALILQVLSPGWAQGIPKADQTYALMVGINNYHPYPGTPALPPLDYAESDARKMAQVFKDYSKGRAATVRLLIDTEASKTAIEAELRDLAKKLGVDDTLVLYYSGYGMSNSNQARLMPSDAKTDDEETWLPLNEVQAIVRQYSQGRGHFILIVDACFCEQAQRGSRSFALPGGKTARKPQPPSPTGGDVVLASWANTRRSWEDAELGGGVFTSYLLQAISGKADSNGDGYVTIGEAYSYAVSRVEEFSLLKGNEQTLKLYGQGDFILAFNPASVAKGKITSLKLSDLISSNQFDALTNWLGSDKLPEDLRLYLGGILSNTQFVSLVRSGAIPTVPKTVPYDLRLQKIGALRQTGKISLEQFWVLSQMIQAGKAPQDVSDYLWDKLKEANFLQRLRAGAIKGVPQK